MEIAVQNMLFLRNVFYDVETNWVVLVHEETRTKKCPIVSKNISSKDSPENTCS